MMNIFLKKIFLAASVAVLVFAALPMSNAFAQGETPPTRGVSNENLERAWARQLKNFERLGKGFENTDAQIAKFQELIDKAAAKGKNVSALQAALVAFEAALNSARPAYQSAQAIVNSHNGFDENGKVIDAEQARSTVQEMRAKLGEVKSLMNGTGRALRAALKAFREANRPEAQSPDERGT
jgi:hypothetical protein